MPLEAGKLRHRVIIQQPVQLQDTYGAPYTEWKVWARVWAAVEPLRGREYWQARQAGAEVDGRIVMRYQPGVTPDMVVVWQGRTLIIQSIIQPQGKTDRLVLLYKEDLQHGAV